MRLLTALPLTLRSGFALLLALPSASAQTAGDGTPGPFEELRAGEEFLEYVSEGPAGEALLYLWLDVFEQVRETTAGLDTVVATSPESAGANGPSTDDRTAFRRGLVRTATAATAARVRLDDVRTFTVQLTPEADRERVFDLLDHRAESLHDRLAQTADLAAAAAACPDAPVDVFRACITPDAPVTWREMRDEIEAAAGHLVQLLEGEPGGE